MTFAEPSPSRSSAPRFAPKERSFDSRTKYVSSVNSIIQTSFQSTTLEATRRVTSTSS